MIYMNKLGFKIGSLGIILRFNLNRYRMDIDQYQKLLKPYMFKLRN